MKKLKDILFKQLTFVAALMAIAALVAIVFSIFHEGLPIFKVVSIKDFLFRTAWYPTHENAEFGIWTLIIGSVAVTAGALVIAIPLGLGSAIFIAEIANKHVRELCKPIIELGPLLQRSFALDTGLNLTTVSIILGVMVVPIISSMSEDALSSVPKHLREASYALGATRWETIIRIVLPAAKTGVLGSILMGFGRAIGETMVVLMVAGGSAQIPKSIFDSVRPMTAAISAEMGETVMGDLHYQSLFAIAIVLFIITFSVSLISELIARKK